MTYLFVFLTILFLVAFGFVGAKEEKVRERGGNVIPYLIAKLILAGFSLLTTSLALGYGFNLM